MRKGNSENLVLSIVLMLVSRDLEITESRAMQYWIQQTKVVVKPIKKGKCGIRKSQKYKDVKKYKKNIK